MILTWEHQYRWQFLHLIIESTESPYSNTSYNNNNNNVKKTWRHGNKNILYVIKRIKSLAHYNSCYLPGYYYYYY